MNSRSTTWIFLVITVLSTLGPIPAWAAPQTSKDSAVWWEKNHGRLTAVDEPLVTRAEAVFSRMVAAADSASARSPRLLVLKENRDPWAAAIPDGTVLLSRGALAICYRGVPPEKGDARLAFILGHELSHQAKDDFWHATAMESIKEFSASGGKPLAVVSSYIEGTSDLGATARAKEVAKVKELQADGYGIVYMTMAGYDPRLIVDKDGTNFIEEFVSQVTGKAAYEDAEHPTAAQRADFLRTQLAAVADEVELFRVGVRYYQQGRYAEAIPYFDRFRVRFPSREVFNNLGLSWYQVALERLSQCDPTVAFHYKLPVLLDTDTLAAAVTRGKGEKSSVCMQDADFIRYIGEAITALERAQAKDVRYLPARINLASAYLLAGRPVKALAAAEDALAIDPGNGDARIVQAAALYRTAAVNGLDAADKALALMLPLASGTAPRSGARYNMAAIERERGQHTRANAHSEAFLKLETVGPYAELAAQSLGRASSNPAPAAKRPTLKPPVPTGDVQAATEKSLKKMTRREMVVGGERVAIYRSSGAIALVVDDHGQEVVDLVESVPSQPISAAAFRKTNGQPRKVVTTPAGETLVYEGLSVDVAAGQIRTMTFFAPKQQGI